MKTFHAMFVHAHPDDESSKGAGTMARYISEGHRITLVTCTDGGAGDILNPKMDLPGVKERIAEIRSQELANALAALGITEQWWLDYPDSGYIENFEGDGSLLAPDCFFNAPIDEAVERLVRIMRRERPDVLVTYPEGGGYPHPDHIRCHDISVLAYDACSDPTRFPDAGEPWTPSKLYYMGTFTRRRMQLIHEAATERGIETPFGPYLERWPEDAPDPTTTRVDVAKFLGQRSKALLAHATQVDPDGMWFAVPDDVMAEVYPHEDFTLAKSVVEVELPEDSLFTGL